MSPRDQRRDKRARLTVLESPLFRPWQIIHDPLCPLVTPLRPPLILDFLLEQQRAEAVERGHGVDVLGRGFAVGELVLKLKPVECGLEGVLCGFRVGRDGRVLRGGQPWALLRFGSCFMDI